MEEEKMKRKFLLLAMYRAMDCLYDEQDQPSDELTLFLSDLNPYIWQERTAADPALQADFDNFLDKQNICAEVDEEIAYYAVKNFLSEQNKKFVEMFEDISLDEWKKLCEIIADEEEK